MDVVKHAKPRSILNQKWVVGSVLIVVIVAILLVIRQSVTQVTLSKKDLLITEVKRGDIDVTVTGYGSLTTDKLQLLTAFSQATVQEIVLKPGAVVTADSIIVKLANPELEQAKTSAEQELSQALANLRQLKVNHKRELLQEKARLAELAALHESALLKKNAEAQLVEQGIVSELTFKESVLRESQLARRIALFKEQNAQLTSVHIEAINIANDRVSQQRGMLAVAQDRVDKLMIKAGIDGVLQHLSVSLGQSLNAGQEVALIGSTSELIALVRVPQSQASLVMIGQKALVDTRLDVVEGQVVRIDPIVSNNTVEVEISLPNELPTSARLQQNVDAEIISKSLTDVLYVQRPANTHAKSEGNFYRITPTGDSASQVAIKFGEKAGKFIQIVQGVTESDTLIISDLSNYKAENISLN
ncbi:efflux RND transporter periplasmic adaptor subunit [Thalassotalea fusca]